MRKRSLALIAGLIAAGALHLLRGPANKEGAWEAEEKRETVSLLPSATDTGSAQSPGGHVDPRTDAARAGDSIRSTQALAILHDRTAPLVGFTPERIAALQQDAWQSTSGIDPKGPDYDESLRQKARAANTLSWSTEKPARTGLYNVYLEPLAGDRTPRLVHIYLEALPSQNEESLKPSWIKFKNPEGEIETSAFANWHSPFQDGETFFKALHFPEDAFFRSLRPKVAGSAGCAELLILTDGVSAHPTLGTFSGFHGLLYCRKSLSILEPLAQTSFQIEDGSDPR